MMVGSNSSIASEVGPRRASELLGGQACEAPDGHCITCGDEGIPMRVFECRADFAVCTDQAGERRDVALDLVGPVQAGDEVLVHAGVAIRRLGLRV